jgi:RHS repeat-associated protein
MSQRFTYSTTSSSRLLADIFTFSAKERDSETGLSYFGSRYYSSDLSIWLSVDPMRKNYNNYGH